MRKKGFLCVCMLLIQILGFTFIFTDVAADSNPPEVTNIFRVPNYPAYGENVTVYATVTDPDGVQQVELDYCSGGVCGLTITMNGPDANDMYWGTIPWISQWENGTVIDHEINAIDTLSNEIKTEKVYYFIASQIDLTTELVETGYTGTSVFLNGTARYNGNETAYVINSNVTVSIIGTEAEFYSTTDAFGNFSVEVVLENAGDFLINTTVSNRSLAGYDEQFISVMGITHISVNTQMTTCYPDQPIWVNGTARYSTGDAVINSDVEVKINETISGICKTDSNGDYSILITVPEALGQYSVNITVVNETMEAHNGTSITVTEVPLPDLVIHAWDFTITSETTPPIPGDEVTLTVVVHNLGSADCADVAVYFYLGDISSDNIMGTGLISQSSVGDNDTLIFTWPATNGTHDIWIVVDPLDILTESFENNNNVTATLFVDDDTDSDGVGDLADDDDDGDELLDTEEVAKGTDPKNPDTDGDGVFDKQDYDPLDPDVTEKPTSQPWMLIIIIIAVVVVVIVLVVFMVKRKK